MHSSHLVYSLICWATTTAHYVTLLWISLCVLLCFTIGMLCHWTPLRMLQEVLCECVGHDFVSRDNHASHAHALHVLRRFWMGHFNYYYHLPLPALDSVAMCTCLEACRIVYYELFPSENKDCVTWLKERRWWWLYMTSVPRVIWLHIQCLDLIIVDHLLKSIDWLSEAGIHHLIAYIHGRYDVDEEWYWQHSYVLISCHYIIRHVISMIVCVPVIR